MARIVDAVGRETNAGEERLVQVLAEYLDDRHIVYRNRTIGGRELDICVLIPDIGLLVIEVKGWEEATVNQVLDGHRISINVGNGTVEQTPKRQAKGYRNALENYIRRELGKFPLVFEMVAYPFISRGFFVNKGMNRVSEEAFTFLRDDLESAQAFRAKLNAAIALTRMWARESFTASLMRQVRSLFEPNLVVEIESDLNHGERQTAPHRWLVPVYSRFCFIAADDATGKQKIDDLVSLYGQGTKVFLITPQKELLDYAAHKVSTLLTSKGLHWDANHLGIALAQSTNGFIPVNQEGFRCFNFEGSLIKDPNTVGGIPSFDLEDGKGLEDYNVKEFLARLDAASAFNYKQYAIEHADPTKSILVRAGAGTGKTHVMISRILFLCYRDGITGGNIHKRISMITFTNDACDNMKKRLKACLENYYLLSGVPDFLDLVAQVESMQISTIHSFARNLIQRVGSGVGYGQDITITSEIHSWRETLAQVLEEYLGAKIKKDPAYLRKLELPIYQLRDLLETLTAQLKNRSVDISALEPEQFGQPKGKSSSQLFHELVCWVLPETERRHNATLFKDNKIHVNNLMSTFYRIVEKCQHRLCELKDPGPQYFFIDEFQDTDDVQIAALLKLGEVMEYRMFVVGDIKQCIYRFRGAEEKAFDTLKIDQAPDRWQCFNLTKNYRTDKRLLGAYQGIFDAWARKHLLVYDRAQDELTSSINLNEGQSNHSFFRRVCVPSQEQMWPTLFQEVDRQVNILRELIAAGHALSANERTIAILVRENWQAIKVRKEGMHYGYPNIKTHTGGDLYQSPPALDLLTLILALLNNRQPERLYALLTSNFFRMTLNRRALYDIRYRRDRACLSVAEREAEALIECIDYALAELGNGQWSWQEILERLRREPVLQVLRQLINLLRPWERYAKDDWSRRFYRMNLELILEKIITSLNTDSLSIHALASFLERCIVTRSQEDCRWPDVKDQDITVACYTVHKTKGLEYGCVLLPYAAFNIERPKHNKLGVTYSCGEVGYRYETDAGDLLCSNYYKLEREKQDRLREETRILYVAMTRAIRSFTWIEVQRGSASPSWQELLRGGTR